MRIAWAPEASGTRCDRKLRSHEIPLVAVERKDRNPEGTEAVAVRDGDFAHVRCYQCLHPIPKEHPQRQKLKEAVLAISWNCVHIANAAIAKALASICGEHGCECPLIAHAKGPHRR